MHYLTTAITGLVLATVTAAQGPVYGVRDFAFPNRSGSGSNSLTARVYYPSTATGNSVPIKPRAGGHPVIVMLHGFSGIGNNYATMGQFFADQGYVIVLPNTARFSATTQVLDALALFPALQVANGSGFLNGALNMNRVGLTGHSMGGGSTCNVLARNVGYRCGISLAGVNASGTIDSARVPLGFIHGTGDTIVPWRTSAQRTYDAARNNYTTLKFFYLMNNTCNHSNLTGLSGATNSVWLRTSRIMKGFFDKLLEDDANGLEEVVGPTARAAGLLQTLSVAARTPSVWFSGTPDIGRTVRPTLLAEPGFGLLATSTPNLVNIPTPFGALRLDPIALTVFVSGTIGATRLLAPPVSIPNDPSLRGARFPLQGLGATPSAGPRFSGVVTLRVN